MTSHHLSPPRLAAMVSCAALICFTGCTASDSFTRSDTNRDGVASCDEFCAYVKVDVFNRMDANHNGQISQAEWLSINPKASSAKFSAADSNRDGMIDRHEADRAFEREGSLTRLFHQIDQDANESLSREEVAAYRAKIQSKPGSSPAKHLTTPSS